jgi:hypothetical protein
LCVARHDRLRPHGGIRGTDIRSTMSPRTIMNVAPPDLNQGFAAAVPVTCAREHLEVSGASPLPGHREAGALGRVRHNRVRGREFLAFHTRASPGAGCSRWRRLIQGSLTIKLADPCEVTPVCATEPCGLTGAVAGIPHKDALARWKPAYQAGQQQPGELGRRFMARPRGLIPFRVARQGHPYRERPGPGRTRELDQHRPDDPRVPPPLRHRAVGRAHAIAMASRAEDVRARAFCDRIIPGQPHRSSRHYISQQPSQQPAGQLPCRPASRRKYPMI